MQDDEMVISHLLLGSVWKYSTVALSYSDYLGRNNSKQAVCESTLFYTIIFIVVKVHFSE